MNKFINKIKYNIIYNKIQYPLLHIVNKEDFDFFKTKDIIFKQRDIITLDNLSLNNQKYNTIILENLENLPLNILKNLSSEGIIFTFSNNEDVIKKELSKYFKFINLTQFSLNLELKPNLITKEITKISSYNKNEIKLITASNYEIPNINNTIELSIDYLNTYINRFFIENDIYLKEKNNLENFKKELNQYSKRENILIQKQKLIKSAISNLLKEIDSNKSIISKNKLQNANYYNYIQSLLNSQAWTLTDNNNLYDIKTIQKIIDLNIQSINEIIETNKKHLEKRSVEPRNTFKLLFNNSNKLQETLKNLYKENNQLIEQNNLYVSEISNLKFDIKETIEAKDDLIITIKELEKQLNTLEEQKDNHYNEVLEEFKKKTDSTISLLKENNEKLKIDTEDLKLIIKKIKEKNNKNILIIDEKSVLIQKLKNKLESLTKELNLKDELVNKKNSLIKDNNTQIDVLKNEIKNKEIHENNLKQEIRENSEKINSSYYKELYDNLEKDYNKMKKKYQKLMNSNQEYKSELEQYELKIQELIGYNERITKDIDIDIDIDDL